MDRAAWFLMNFLIVSFVNAVYKTYSDSEKSGVKW